MALLKSKCTILYVTLYHYTNHTQEVRIAGEQLNFYLCNLSIPINQGNSNQSWEQFWSFMILSQSFQHSVLYCKAKLPNNLDEVFLGNNFAGLLRALYFSLWPQTLTAWFLASISHMFSASILQASSWPQWAAAWSGVQPSTSLAFISAPACSNTLQTHSQHLDMLILS